MANSYPKGYSDGSALTEALLDSNYGNVKLDIANTDLMTQGSTSGHFLKSNGSSVAASFAAVPDPIGPNSIRNYGLTAVASASALVIRLKTNSGGDPSTTDVVDAPFTTAGTVSATYTNVTATSAKSISVTASATLGFTGTAANRVYVYAINNSGTLRLAVSARGDLDDGTKITTTAIASSADNGTTLYATAALTVAARLIGFVEAALNSSSQWQTPTLTSVVNGQYKQGEIISSSSGSFSTNSTTSTPVTNLTATIKTTGQKNIIIELFSDNSSNVSQLAVDRVGALAAGQYEILRGTTTISIQFLQIRGADSSPSSLVSGIPPSSLRCLDVLPAKGTYTYSINVKATQSGTTISARYCKLRVKEEN